MIHAALLSLALLGAGTSPTAIATVVPEQIELADFAGCLVRQAPKQSEKLLHTALGSTDEHDAANMLARGHLSCIHGTVLSGHSGALRGVVAQAMLMREPALFDRISALPAVAPVRPERAKGRVFLIQYGQCLSAADPKATVALLRTGYDTPEEHDAFLAYGDNLTACMPMGQQYHLDIADMRNQIAAIAYLAANPVEAK